MSAWLESLQDQSRFDLFELDTIGRALDCTVRVEDLGASRQHAMVRKQNNNYYFYDLGGRNGSYINQKRVITATKLKDGDVIGISDTNFRFHNEVDYEDSQTMGMLERTVARVKTMPMIMIVSDVKGFTKLAQGLDPAELAQVIGAWYKECNAVLPKRGAHIDNFGGDSVLSYWQDVGEEAKVQSLLAARDLVQICTKIRDQHAEIFDRHRTLIAAGVALNQGNVAHGGMEAGAFTMLGDAVNVTFRLEGLTRALDTDIVAGKDYVEGFPNAEQFFEYVGEHDIKGRSGKSPVYKVKAYPAE